MSTDETNPYQASGTDPKPPAGPRASMEYMQAVQYVFESPKWMANLLWGSLCLLSTSVIPVVGQLILMGYQFEIVEVLLCKPPKKGYPDFDPNRCVEYLVRGLWIFLVTLVLMLVFAPVIVVFTLGGVGIFFGLAAATEGDEAAMTVGAMITIGIMFLVMFVMSIAMLLVATPFTIRAGLTQDFRASFDFAWIKDFVRRMWKEIFLATLFLMAVAVPAVIIGLLLCIVGLYPAMTALMLTQGHLYLQMYQLYLARGGEKIPLKPSGPIQPTTSA